MLLTALARLLDGWPAGSGQAIRVAPSLSLARLSNHFARGPSRALDPALGSELVCRYGGD